MNVPSNAISPALRAEFYSVPVDEAVKWVPGTSIVPPLQVPEVHEWHGEEGRSFWKVALRFFSKEHPHVDQFQDTQPLFQVTQGLE